MKSSVKALISISLTAACIVLIFVYSFAWFTASNTHVEATGGVFSAASAGETVGELTLGGIMNLKEDGEYSGQTGEYYYYYVLSPDDPAHTYIDTDSNTEGIQYLTKDFTTYDISVNIYAEKEYTGISTSTTGDVTNVLNQDLTYTVIDSSSGTTYYTVYSDQTGSEILYTTDPTLSSSAKYVVRKITVDESGDYPVTNVKYLSGNTSILSYGVYTRKQYEGISETYKTLMTFKGTEKVVEEDGSWTISNIDGTKTIVTSPDSANPVIKIVNNIGGELFVQNHSTEIELSDGDIPTTTVIRDGIELNSASYIMYCEGTEESTVDNVRTVTNSDGTTTKIIGIDLDEDGIYDQTRYEIYSGETLLFSQIRGESESDSFKITVRENKNTPPTTIVDIGDRISTAKYRIIINKDGTTTYYNTLSPYNYALYDSSNTLLYSASSDQLSKTTISIDDQLCTTVLLEGSIISGETLVYKHYERVGQKTYVTETIGTYDIDSDTYSYTVYDRRGNVKYDENNADIAIDTSTITGYAVTNSSSLDNAYRFTKKFTVKITVPEGKEFNLYCAALSIGLVGEYELDIDPDDLRSTGKAFCTYITITENDSPAEGEGTEAGSSTESGTESGAEGSTESGTEGGEGTEGGAESSKVTTKIYLFGLEDDTKITSVTSESGVTTTTYVVNNYDNSVTTAVYEDGVLVSLKVIGGPDPDNPYNYNLDTENVSLTFNSNKIISYIDPSTLLRDFYWELSLPLDGGYGLLSDSEEDDLIFENWKNDTEGHKNVYIKTESGYESISYALASFSNLYYCEFEEVSSYVEGEQYFGYNASIYYFLSITSQSEFNTAYQNNGNKLYKLVGGSISSSVSVDDYVKVFKGEKIFTKGVGSDGNPFFMLQNDEDIIDFKLYKKNDNYYKTFYPGSNGKLVDSNGEAFLLEETTVFEDCSLTLYFLDGASLDKLDEVEYGFDFDNNYYVVNQSQVKPFQYSDIEFMGTRFMLEFDVFGGQSN